MFSRINVARKATAFATFTLNLNTPVGNNIPEGDIGLDVNWVPADLDESLARAQLVRTGNIWRPVSNWLVLGSPDACILDTDTRGIDVVTAHKLANLSN